MSVSPESLALLERAAELRAAGTPWADAATRLAVTHDELRRLASEHRRDYERLSRRARDVARREAVADAVAALRRMVNTSDTRIGLSAATTLVRYELAMMRHGTQQAALRLDRKLTLDAENGRNTNTSESTEVPKQQGVIAPKKTAQPSVQNTPRPASPTPAKAAVATATTTPQDKPAAPVAATGPIPPEELARRRRLLLNDFALGRAVPLDRNDRVDQEVTRIVDGLLVGGKVDDAPPG
jgi:hypothetical protein